MTPAPFAYLGLAVVIALVFWFIRKAGKDAAQKGAATDALKDINNALRPIEPADIDKLRDKYKRD